MNKNQIYLRLGKPKRFKPIVENKPMHPVKFFIIKWILILGFLYFFLDDMLRFIFNMF